MNATSTTPGNTEDVGKPEESAEDKDKKKKKIKLDQAKSEIRFVKVMNFNLSGNVTHEITKAFDAAKTKMRISHELPNCNWLEKKIKEIEQNRHRR